jgi:hypothetical protein
MAWSDEMTLILRTTVADFVTPQVYTDGQLQTMLLVGSLASIGNSLQGFL